MVDRNVGFGKTFAAIGAGIAAAGSGDDVIVFDEDAFGGKTYIESPAPKDGVTVKSSDPEKPYTLKSWLQAPADVTATIQDFIATAGLPQFNNTGVDLTIANFFIFMSGGTIDIRAAGSTFRFNNGIIYAPDRGIAGQTGAGPNIICNYVMVLFAIANGFQRSTGTFTCDNCIGWQSGTNNFSGVDSGNNNATSTQGGAAGLTGDVTGLVEADMAFAYVNSPVGGSKFPLDFRAIESVLAENSSKLENAGILVSGVTTDMNGRTRADPPNIGPTEDFGGFSAAAGLIIHPGMAGGLITLGR